MFQTFLSPSDFDTENFFFKSPYDFHKDNFFF